MKTLIRLIAGMAIITALASCEDNYGVEPEITPTSIDVKLNEPFTVYLNDFDKKKYPYRPTEWDVRPVPYSTYESFDYDIISLSADSMRLRVTRCETPTCIVKYKYVVSVPLVPATHWEETWCTVHIVD